MLDILKSVALETGTYVLENFRKKVSVSEKYSFQDLVTEIDENAQASIKKSIITQLISQNFDSAKIAFIGEENLHETEKEHLFIIDPIDGTNNYVCGIERFSITIAYLHKGKVTASVIYEPYNNYLYTAEKGKGAYKIANGHSSKLEVADLPIRKTVMTTHLSKYKEARETVFKLYDAIYPSILGIRIYASIALDIANISEGAALFAVYGNGKLYDLAGPSLILEESGGVLTNLDGSKLTLDLAQQEKHYPFIACHPNQLKDIVTFTSQL